MQNQRAVNQYEKARVLHQKGRLSDAERSYKKAIKSNKNFVEAYNNLGNVLVDRGRLKEASDTYRKALKLLPDHPMLLNNLGNALQLQGDNEKAISWFKKAISQDSRYADAYCNLGNALRDTGESEEAVAAYERSIQIDPGVADSYSNLGGMQVELGEVDEAVKNFKKAVSIDSWHKEAFNGLGNAQFIRDEIDEAIFSYYKAIDIDPDDKNAYYGLGKAISKKGDKRKANTAYEKAIEMDPSNLAAYLGMGANLIALEEIEAAITIFNRVKDIDPTNTSALLGLGSAFNILGETDKANAMFQASIEIDPDCIDGHSGLAHILSDQGQIDEAIAKYREAIAIDPESAPAYRSLAKNKKFIKRDDDVLAMESLYSADDIDDEKKMHLAYGLGKVYEDLGEYDRSIELVIKAAGLHRASLDHSISKTEAFFAKLKEAFSAGFFSDHKQSGYSDQTPIFILGMPRSGTSLTEQILASHAEVFGAGELNYVISVTKMIIDVTASTNYFEKIDDVDAVEFENLGKEYIKKIRRHSETAKFITDKMPGNFLHIGFIKAILPNAKIVHLNRDPMDNALSIFKNYFPKGHQYSYDLVELGHYYRHYLDLMEHWRKTLPGFMYDLSYEGLVADLEGQTRLLLDYCNLPWDEACLEFHKTRRKVKTASNAQVRRPIYKDSVNLWKRYEKQLQPLHDAIYS